MADEAKAAHLVRSDGHTRLYVDIMRAATDVYNLRATGPLDTTTTTAAAAAAAAVIAIATMKQRPIRYRYNRGL